MHAAGHRGGRGHRRRCVASSSLSGPVAQAVGDAIGLGSTAVTVWSIAKWPVLRAGRGRLVAILYQLTPNVRQPKMDLDQRRAPFVAILVWVLASPRFALYVATFASYDATYGAFGRSHRVPPVAVDHQPRAALRRRAGRRARARAASCRRASPPRSGPAAAAGHPREREAAAKHEEDVERGRQLRLSRGESDDRDGEERGDRAQSRAAGSRAGAGAGPRTGPDPQAERDAAVRRAGGTPR